MTMDEHDDSEMILESRQSRRALNIVFLILTAMCVLLAILVSRRDYAHTPPMSQGKIVATVACGIGLCAFGPALWCLISWSMAGSITVNQDGISKTSGLGRTKSLRWKDVEQIKCYDYAIALRSSTTMIEIPWCYLDDPPRTAARQRLGAASLP